MTLIVSKEDVTTEVLELVEDIVDGWYQGRSVDWEDVWDRLEKSVLDDGTEIDFGPDLDTPAMRKIKKHIRDIRKEA